jgi:hypothetical protein
MTLDNIRNLFIGHVIELNDKFYHFHTGNRLEITGFGTEPARGQYQFRQQDNIVYLSTKPSIFEGKAEFSVEIVLDGKVSLSLENS